MALVQGTEGVARGAAQTLITGTDIPVLLGLSPYRCEADLADEKLNGSTTEANPPYADGERAPGPHRRGVRASHRAATSPRFRGPRPTTRTSSGPPPPRLPSRRVRSGLVEAKRTSSRSRFADGLPQDVEAQVAWQLGLLRLPGGRRRCPRWGRRARHLRGAGRRGALRGPRGRGRGLPAPARYRTARSSGTRLASGATTPPTTAPRCLADEALTEAAHALATTRVTDCRTSRPPRTP